MGKTAFSGPVYGAKSLLWTFGPVTSSTGASTTLLATNAIRVVPPYEDWFITEGSWICSTNSSVALAHNIVLKVEGGSSNSVPRQNGQGTTNAATIFAAANAAGSTTWSTWATATVSAGEYEGTWCPGGSTIRLLTSGATAIAGFQINVMGFIRYINSTRGE